MSPFLFTMQPQVEHQPAAVLIPRNLFRCPYHPLIETTLETLSAAFRNGDVALMECQVAGSGQLVPVICAVNPHDDGSRTLIPFAQMFNDDPYFTIIPNTRIETGSPLRKRCGWA